MRSLALVLLLCAALVAPAAAVQPDEVLADPALEARARAVSAQLRCMVCQNQSIDDSDAPLARDLRLLVRERIEAGDSDADVLSFVVARYGEFVLLKPRLAPHTLLLWLAPLAALLLGGVMVWRFQRRRMPGARSGPAVLSAAERRRLEKLLSGE